MCLYQQEESNQQITDQLSVDNYKINKILNLADKLSLITHSTGTTIILLNISSIEVRETE